MEISSTEMSRHIVNAWEHTRTCVNMCTGFTICLPIFAPQNDNKTDTLHTNTNHSIYFHYYIFYMAHTPDTERYVSTH